MRVPRVVPTIVVALLIAVSQRASALKFTALPLQNGKLILFVHDCGRLPDEVSEGRNANCEPWEAQFTGARNIKDLSGRVRRYPGDSAMLDDALRRGRYEEIWLWSGGGDVVAGIGIGRLLRARQATVRVTKEATCASSCTIAFMGGLFRYLDIGSKFKVHSASGFMQGVDEMDTVLTTAALRDLAHGEQVYARMFARQLVTHFQNTFLARYPDRRLPENDLAFRAWAESYAAAPAYTAERARRDSARVAAEGPAAEQDVLMNVEHDMMVAAIQDVRTFIRANPRYAERAEPALRLVELMYTTLIVDTHDVTRDELLQLGYITPDVVSP